MIQFVRRRLPRPIKRRLRLIPFLTLWLAIQRNQQAYRRVFRFWYWLYCQSWVQALFLRGHRHLLRGIYQDIQPLRPMDEAAALRALGEQFHYGFNLMNTASSFNGNIHLRGLEHLENSQGVLLVSAHHFLSYYALDHCLSRLRGVEFIAVGRENRQQIPEKYGPQNPELYEQYKVLQRVQELQQARYLLKRRGVVIILADGTRGLPAIKMRFLKRERPFASGMGQLAALSGKPVLLIDCHLQPDGRFQGNIFPLGNAAEENSDVQQISQYYTSEYVRWLEEVWRCHPESISTEYLARYIISPVQP